MEKFDIDNEQLYKSEKNKRRKEKPNHHICILVLFILILFISFFVYCFNKFMGLENEVKLLKKEYLKLNQKYLINTVSSKSNNVLLISNAFSNDEKTSPPLLYELLKNLSFISNIKIIHPLLILDKLTEVNLINYNIVIFDLKRSGYENTKTNIELIKQYIILCGIIFVTHDLWTGLAGPQELFGGYRYFQKKGSIVNKAEIVYNKHKIFYSFYDLSEEKNINIANTHFGWMKVNETLKKRRYRINKIKR